MILSARISALLARLFELLFGIYLSLFISFFLENFASWSSFGNLGFLLLLHMSASDFGTIIETQDGWEDKESFRAPGFCHLAHFRRRS